MVGRRDPPPSVRPPRRRDERDGRHLAHRAVFRRRHDAGSRSSTRSRRACPAGAWLVDRLLHAADRRADAGDVPRRSPRRWRRPTRPPTSRHDESINMSTTSRLDHRDRPDHGRRDRPRRLPARAARRLLAGQADRPIRPVAVPQPGRGPDRRLRSRRLDAAADRPPARPVQPVRARRGAARPRGRRAAARRGRRRRVRERIGIYLGSALGGIAYAEDPARALPRARDQGRRAEPRPGGVRWRGAGQPRDRARRSRPDPLDGELMRVRRGRDRRGAQRDPRRARSMPRSPAARRSP